MGADSQSLDVDQILAALEELIGEYVMVVFTLPRAAPVGLVHGVITRGETWNRGEAENAVLFDLVQNELPPGSRRVGGFAVNPDEVTGGFRQDDTVGIMSGRMGILISPV